MNKNLIAIDPSFPQDRSTWTTEIKLHHISPLQTKQLTNTLSTTVHEAKHVIPSKVLNSKQRYKQTRNIQKNHQRRVLTATSRCPKLTLALSDCKSPPHQKLREPLIGWR